MSYDSEQACLEEQAYWQHEEERAYYAAMEAAHWAEAEAAYYVEMAAMEAAAIYQGGSA